MRALLLALALLSPPGVSPAFVQAPALPGTVLPVRRRLKCCRSTEPGTPN